MECSRCPVAPVVHAFTEADLENSLGRCQSKAIREAVQELRVKFNAMCLKCSSADPKYRAKIQSAVEALKKKFNGSFPAIYNLVTESNQDLRNAISDVQTAFQKVCLTCYRESNDDNPSNHGQTFFSTDSGLCRAASGKAGYTHTDNNDVISRADWINSHASTDSGYAQDNAFRPYSNAPEDIAEKMRTTDADKSLTDLPADVEERLLKELSEFAALDPLDKMMIACMTGGMKISEFSRMLWLPHNIIDPVSRKVRPISKQSAQARWNNVMRKCPHFAVIAAGNYGKRVQARNLKMKRYLAEKELADRKLAAYEQSSSDSSDASAYFSFRRPRKAAALDPNQATFAFLQTVATNPSHDAFLPHPKRTVKKPAKPAKRLGRPPKNFVYPPPPPKPPKAHKTVTKTPKSPKTPKTTKRSTAKRPTGKRA